MSWPSASSRRATGAKSGGWGEFAASIQTRIRTGSPPVLDQVPLGDLANLSGGHAHHHRPCRDVPSHDRARGYERLLPDVDTWTQDDATPDATRAPQCGALDGRPRCVAGHRVVVGHRDPRADEDVVLDSRVRGDVA